VSYSVAFVLRLTPCLVAVSGCQPPATLTGSFEAEPVAVTRFRADSVAYTTYSGINDSLHVVIRDLPRWRDYWGRIHSPFFPQPPAPAIDFRREMVILAALGRRPSLGYDILITSALRDSAGIEVFLVRSKPTQGCPVPAAITEPVDLARIPTSDLPVRFTERITAIPCGAQ